MRITQRHDDTYSHKRHWENSLNHSDKPWDEACLNSGRQYFAPQNDFIIEEILGLNTNVTNSIRLKSNNKLYMPYKIEPDYLYFTLTHLDEDTIKNLKKGQILKKGEKIILEGKDGANAYHWHCTANIGKYYGFLQNSNGAWCFTYEKSLLPNEAFYVDLNHTTITDSNGYNFQEIPIEYFGNTVVRNELVDQVEILETNVRARSMPSIINGETLGYMHKGIYDIVDIDICDGYTWYKNDEVWFAFSKEWGKILPKKNIELSNNKTEEKNSNIKQILHFIINLLKKILKI